MTATKTAQAAAKPAVKSTEAKPRPVSYCKCGCGAQVVKQYKPGHDARHASQLRQAVAEGKLTRAAALKAASEISPAFIAKVTRSLDSLAREQGKDANGK